MYTYITYWARPAVAMLVVLLTHMSVNAVTITVTTAADAGAGSLRDAITTANGTPAADVIEFNIPGAGVQTINLASTLPLITNPLTIDGYSQPGASENTLDEGNNAVLLIELNGTAAGAGTDGLSLGGASSNSVIQGLVINRFLGDGISIASIAVTNVTIRGNFIGTNAAGTSGSGNGENGILIAGSNNTIGGSEPEHRNVISGNTLSGIFVDNVQSPANNNNVFNNYIGTTKAGTAALANTLAGVRLGTSLNTTIGGVTSKFANIIAFNGEDGVQVDGPLPGGSTGNRILGNSIFSNGGLGIDLNDDGVTLNDAQDPDTGNNNLSNFPVLTSATTNDDGTTIQGTLNALPNTSYRIEFFVNDSADPSGNGEGRKFLGSTNVMTDASGDAEFTFESDDEQSTNDSVAATATDEDNNTSEFSLNRDITSAPTLDDNDDDDGDDEDDDDSRFLATLPIPVPPPFWPWDEDIADVPAAVAPAPVAVATPVVTVDSLSPVSDRAPAPQTPMESEASMADDKEASGCSTTGPLDLSSMMLFISMLLALRFRRRQT